MVLQGPRSVFIDSHAWLAVSLKIAINQEEELKIHFMSSLEQLYIIVPENEEALFTEGSM